MSTDRSLPVEVLCSEGDVRALADDARAEGAIAIDTEFFWERTYAPVLCLLQVATRQRIALIDPMADGAVGPIAEVVADPGVEVVMHAPGCDLLLFALRYDSVATRVFDTQLAAGFVGLGSGLGYDRLVLDALNVRLQHNETFSDWRARPLSKTQLAYAADDVRYLFPLVDVIRERLRELGREQWAADELARRYGNGTTIVPDPDAAFLKVAGRGRMHGRQAGVLCEVAAWREREARRRDLPAGWLVKDPSLVEVARQQPADEAALRRIRGMSNLSARDVEHLLAAIARGKELQLPPGPREPSRGVARRVAVGSALAAVLVRARCEGADITPELVATRKDLEEFALAVLTDRVDGSPLLQGWRRELVGDVLVELLQGKIALAVSERTPHVEVMRR